MVYAHCFKMFTLLSKTREGMNILKENPEVGRERKSILKENPGVGRE